MSLKPAWTMEKPYLKERKKKLMKKETVVKIFSQTYPKRKNTGNGRDVCSMLYCPFLCWIMQRYCIVTRMWVILTTQQVP